MASKPPPRRAFENELERAYRHGRGRPVGFVDESMRLNPHLGVPFYTMTGVLIEHDNLQDVRRAVLATGRSTGGKAWHTTDAYEQGRHEQIERMVALVAERSEWSIVTVDAPIQTPGGAGEIQARAACLRALVPELTRGTRGARTLILDHRTEAGDKDDLRIAAELRGSGIIGRDVLVRHSSDDLEPLLCTPDVAGWAARRLLTVDETRWIEPARDAVTIIHAGTGTRFTVDDLAQKHNSAGQAAAIPTPPDSATRSRSHAEAESELLPSPVSQEVAQDSTLDRLLRRARERPARPPNAANPRDLPDRGPDRPGPTLER